MRKKALSLISAVAAVLTVMPAFNSVNAYATEYPEKIRDNIVDVNLKDIDAYDFNRDGEVNFKDYKVLETKINDSYTYKNDLTKKIPYTTVTSDMKITNSEYSSYDINKDHYYSTDDYCSFLKALCSKMTDVSINHSEMTASIVKYDDPEEDILILPTEYYSDEDDRIYPITEIKSNAFITCKKLEEITIDNYRQPNIKDAFGFQIKNAGEVTASNPLNIESYAFSGCKKLKDVYLPQNITIDSDAFYGTLFNSNSDNHFTRCGIDYFYDTDYTTLLAASIVDEDAALSSSGTFSFLLGTTAINKEFFKSRSAEYRNSIINLTIPFSVNYIGEDAFKKCFNLETVNGKEYSELSDDYKSLINKYISAFNSTNFMAKETQSKIDAIVEKVNNELDQLGRTPTTKEKATAAARAIVDETYYTQYWADKNSFSLYPDTLYHTLDLCRGALGSEHAAFTCHYTMCGGIAYAYSFILDSIGVKNYYVGAADHAYNQIFDEEEHRWHSIDLNLACSNYVNYSDIDKTIPGTDSDRYETAKANKLEEARKNVEDYIYNDYYMRRDSNINGNSSFTLFENSKDKQFTEDGQRFYFTYGDDRSKLYVYLYQSENDNFSFTISNQENIETNMNFFDFFNRENNYLTTAPVSFGPWKIGGFEYYIEDNGMMRDGTIEETVNGITQEVPSGYDDWNGRKYR